MMKIRLAIRTGEHVVEVMIPPFKLLPEIIVWGERFFTLHEPLLPKDPDGPRAEYREGFAYYVIESQQ